MTVSSDEKIKELFSEITKLKDRCEAMELRHMKEVDSLRSQLEGEGNAQDKASSVELVTVNNDNNQERFDEENPNGEEDKDGPSNERTEPNVRISNLFKLAKKVSDRFVGKDENEEEVIDIGSTIHMYSIYCIVKRHWIQALLMTCFSLLFVTCQVIVLQKIVVEAAHPTCAAHSDCNQGQFCKFNMDSSLAALCGDCDEPTWNVDTEQCDAIFQELDIKGWDTGNTKQYIDRDSLTQETSDCLSKQYCIETDTPGSCDHYKLNKFRLDSGMMAALIFLSLIGFAPALSGDQEQVITEEILLHRELKALTTLTFQQWAISQLMYFVLRVRCYVMPFLAAAATSSIIFANRFSVSNFVLNILAIVFLVEIDDVAVAFILKPTTTQVLEEFIEPTVRDSRNESFSMVTWLYPRVSSAVASVLMFVRLIAFPANSSCGVFFDQVLLISVVIALIFGLLNALRAFVHYLMEKKIFKAIDACLIHAWRTICAFSYSQYVFSLNYIGFRQILHMNAMLAVVTIATFVVHVFRHKGLGPLKLPSNSSSA